MLQGETQKYQAKEPRLRKLNQIDPMGIDLLGFSCSDTDENSGIIIRERLRAANYCCTPC